MLKMTALLSVLPLSRIKSVGGQIQTRRFPLLPVVMLG